MKAPKARSVEPRRNRSAVEVRRGEITRQLERIRSRLSSKSPSQYADETASRRHLGRTLGLISELEGELSMLNCPGDYDELPAAVVADELGLRLDQIRLLIKVGEAEATGKRAHLRVSRAELERLVRLGPMTLLMLSSQGAEYIFTEAVKRLKAGDLVAAQRAYNRIKARETCIGDYALTLEMALDLAEGRYEDARQVVNFVLSEKLWQRDAVSTHLSRVLLGNRFKSNEARGEALRLLKLLGLDSFSAIEPSEVAGGTELTALFVAAAAQEAVRELVIKHLLPPHLDEFNRRLRDAVFTALYAQTHSRTSVRSIAYLAELERRVSHFWEPLHLLDDLHEE